MKKVLIGFFLIVGFSLHANAGLISLEESNNYTFTFASGAYILQEGGPNLGVYSEVDGVNVEFACGSAEVADFTNSFTNFPHEDRCGENNFRGMVGIDLSMKDMISGMVYDFEIVYLTSYDRGQDIGYLAASEGALPAGFAERSIIFDISGINEVPAPSTLAIFVLGILGLASRRLKKVS